MPDATVTATSGSRSSGSAGWGRCTPAPAPGCSSTTPTARCAPRLVAVADPDAERRDEARSAPTASTDAARRLARGCWRATTSTSSASAGPTSCTARSASRSPRPGKHLWVEKPAGRNRGRHPGDRRGRATRPGCGRRSGSTTATRRPSSAARQLVGRRAARRRSRRSTVRLLADYSAHPDGALSWRFDPEYAGTGVLGDLGQPRLRPGAVRRRASAVGGISELVADRPPSSPSGPVATGAVSHFARGGDGPRTGRQRGPGLRAAAVRLGRPGLPRRPPASRWASSALRHRGAGHPRRAVAWDFRRMGELQVCLDQDYQDARLADAARARPATASWPRSSPGPGVTMGYDDLKVIEAQRLVASPSAPGGPYGATIEDAVVTAAPGRRHGRRPTSETRMGQSVDEHDPRDEATA